MVGDSSEITIKVDECWPFVEQSFSMKFSYGDSLFIQNATTKVNYKSCSDLTIVSTEIAVPGGCIPGEGIH